MAGRGHEVWRVALAAAVLAGCGTTVPLQGSGQSADAGLGPLQPGTSLTPGADTTGGGGLIPGTATSGGATGTGTSGTSGSALPGPTFTRPPVPGPGRTLPPIEIGSYYLEGASGALSAQGFGGLVIPDNKPLFDAMVRYLNAHGGLGGRQIKTVWFKYVSGGDPSTQDAAACQTFTEDHHVFLVIGGIGSGAGLLGPCLTRHGVPLIGANAGGDARYFSENHRFIYEPGQASFTRGLSTLVGDLHAGGWFTGTHKIGVVQYEGAVYDHAVDDGLVTALGRLGLTVFDRVKYSGADNNSIAQGSASAVLKFNTEHVDRVIFMGPGGAAANDFMGAASTQHYYPKYGVWSADSPYILGILSPPDQLANATGIGYQPGLDVAGTQDPTATTPAGKACLTFWDSVGQTDHSALNNPLQRATCDIFSTLLRAVAAGAGTTTSTAALEAGYDAVGGSYSPAGTFIIRFRPGSHDAAGGYRRLVYQTSCKCFRYVGATRPLP
jgi:ABC-type branched-subunit amino acid transport system substrate-binding protein